MRYLFRGILYVGVYVLLALLFRGHGLARSIFGNVGLLIPAITVCVIIVRRRSDWRGAQRLFWDACLLGMTLWCIGHVGWAFSDLVLNQVSWVQWHALFSLCGGLGLLVSLLARPHLGVRDEATGAIAVKLVSYATLGGFIYAYFVLVPSVVPAGASSAENTLLKLVQVQRLLLVLATGAAAYVGRRTAWRFTYSLLFVGATAGFFLRLVTSLAIADGSYHSGSLFDLAWIIPFLFDAWAALAAPASAAESTARVPVPSGAPSAVLSAIPVLLIPLIGYGLLGLQPLGEPGDSFRVLLTTMTTVAGLGLMTLRLSMQGTELQRADARLRLLAAATEQTGDLILITKADGGFEHANDACVRALGYSRRELSGLFLQDLLDRGFETPIKDIPAQVREKGLWRGTLLHRRRDGSVFPVSSTVAALKDVEGEILHYVAVERDITDELRLRDQLVHSERMSAVGELVAGVAHEINNPLQTIVGCVELLLEERKGDEDDDQARDLHLVRQEAARAGQIVRNLLAFVRRGASERVSTDLNQIVQATADLRHYHLVQQNITLVLDLHADALPVLANREEIQQVVLNLLMNAEQALVSGPGAGTIVLKTTSTGASHTLQVTDDGPGIGQDLRGKIFEPFFTTKEVGQGTGLGLSISLGIASSHGGTLELGDAPAGACFKLTLPAQVLAPARTTVPAVHVNGATGEARRRALVIDDESAIRDLLTRLLDRRGFAVAQAPTAAEGRRLMQQPFDLVLCDVQLGDGSGSDCYHYLRHTGALSSTRFAFITGDAGAIDDMPETAGVAVLAKPFTASDLDRLLADVQVAV